MRIRINMNDKELKEKITNIIHKLEDKYRIYSEKAYKEGFIAVRLWCWKETDKANGEIVNLIKEQIQQERERIWEECKKKKAEHLYYCCPPYYEVGVGGSVYAVYLDDLKQILDIKDR